MFVTEQMYDIAIMASVVIVGAGPAGVTSALLLARQGVEVTLLERETAFDRVFRGEGVTPSGVRALREMGLGETLERLPQRLLESWHIFIDGEEILTIPEPQGETGPDAFRVLPQPPFLEAVVALASRYPNVRFLPGTNVAELLRDDDGRVAGVRASGPDGERDHPADLVLACDGRGSLLRKRAGIELELLPESYDILWTKLPAPETMRGSCRFWITVAAGEHPTFTFVSWDDRLQIGVIAPKGQLAELRGDRWLDGAVGSLPTALRAHVLAERERVDPPVRLNVLVGRAERWSVPGLLLLGDAAHPMSPVRAQGINQAFRDVIVAANRLLPALTGGADHAAIDAALRAIEAERVPEIAKAQTLQRREAQGQGDARSGSWRFRLAKGGARMMGRYRWAQRAWLARQKGLRDGVTEVALDPRWRADCEPVSAPGLVSD